MMSCGMTVSKMQIAHRGLVREGVMWTACQGSLAIVKLTRLVAELRVAARAKKAAKWGKAAGRNQTVKVEAAFATVADQHGICAFRAVAQGKRQVGRDRGWWIGLGCGSVEDGQGTSGGRTVQAVAKSIKLAAGAKNASHAA